MQKCPGQCNDIDKYQRFSLGWTTDLSIGRREKCWQKKNVSGVIWLASTGGFQHFKYIYIYVRILYTVYILQSCCWPTALFQQQSVLQKSNRRYQFTYECSKRLEHSGSCSRVTCNDCQLHRMQDPSIEI